MEEKWQGEINEVINEIKNEIEKVSEEFPITKTINRFSPSLLFTRNEELTSKYHFIEPLHDNNYNNNINNSNININNNFAERKITFSNSSIVCLSSNVNDRRCTSFTSISNPFMIAKRKFSLFFQCFDLILFQQRKI